MNDEQYEPTKKLAAEVLTRGDGCATVVVVQNDTGIGPTVGTTMEITWDDSSKMDEMMVVGRTVFFPLRLEPADPFRAPRKNPEKEN